MTAVTGPVAAPLERDAGPPISLIVNTCDRCDALRSLLISLENQDYPNFEVVVVVGPTSDETGAMIAAEFGNRVTTIDCPVFNLSVSRNVGLNNAAGEIVAFIDDDARPCPTWLSQLAAAYSDPKIAGAGGRTYNALPDSGELQFLSGMFSVLAEQEDIRDREGPPVESAVTIEHWFPRLHGTNMSYRRRALAAVGGFDERYEYLFDDADIAARMARAGFLLSPLRQAVVYHQPGQGRNRGRHRYDLNWYCWSRSAIYFALKNGRPAVGLLRSLAAALRIASNFRTQVRELNRRGDMPDDLFRSARKQLDRGLIAGVFQGLCAPRRVPGRISEPVRQLVPFPRLGTAAVKPRLETGLGASTEGSGMQKGSMRVCLLSVGYPPADTHGVSRSTHTLARGLVEIGHEVHVITSGDHRRTRLDGDVHIHEVNGAVEGRYDSYAAAGYPNLGHWLNHSHAVHSRLQSLQVNHEIQIVDSPLWNLDGIVTAVASQVPVVVRVVTAMKQIARVHGQENDENLLLADLEEEFLGMAAAILSNSKGTVKTLTDVYGMDLTERCHRQVPYGLIPAPEHQVPEPISDRAGESSVLFVGRLEGRKGILDLFEAIPNVLDEAPRTRFVIAGGDNSHEDGFRTSHRTDYPGYFRKAYPSHADRVEFLGFVDEARLQQLYRECDVFVAPSLYESFGLVFLEAMNYAKPVVGCSAGGPEDIIVDGETGILVPPGDPGHLADALSRLVRSQSERGRLGRAGRERLLKQYSHVAMAEAFAEAYREVLSSGAGSTAKG